ncbi:MAG: DNA polymerase I [Phycisphaerae bacterium]|nr:DNA polymerase I [Phycisphaerae bacterium]
MTRSVYIIDGHAQIFRSYYAPFPNLTSPTGEPTRATHVFFQMLLNLVRDCRPEFLVMAMDTSDETVFRCQLYPQYKSHREPPPEDFEPQARRIEQTLAATGVPILKVPGFEADDIMATLAARLTRAYPDLHVYLVSKDKDLDQVLTPRVSLFDPARNETIAAEQLFDIKGWHPQQALDVQTLVGDSVDNVPGVTGIGPKTAAKLIQKYGTAAAVIAHADELTPKQRENVLAFAPNLDLTRDLLRLRDDVPLDFDLDRARTEDFDWVAMRTAFRELGFRRLTEQVPAGSPGETRAASELPPGTGPGHATEAGVAASRSAGPAPAATPHPVIATVEPSRLAALRTPVRGDYRLINTRADFDIFVEEVSRQSCFAFDTETTNVNAIDADIVGLSFCWEVGRAVYIAVRSALGDAVEPDYVRERLTPLFADRQRLKVGQNCKYDVVALRGAGIAVEGPLFDTMVASFLLDSTRSSHGLDALVAGLLGHQMIPISDLIGKGRDQLRMDQVPLAHICEYACEDADYTWRLKELFEPQLAALDLLPLFRDTEMPLVSVLAEMEYNGVAIDAELLKVMSRQHAQRCERIAGEIHTLAGGPFNIDSPKQLAEILFDRMQFRVVRKTATARSTDAEALETLAEETGHELPRRLIEYRELQKLRSTYLDALPRSVSRRTGRIHTSFHQTGAVTGRLSSSEPNLQNIPIRTDLGREIRRAFVPRSADELLIVADYSQIELRILAHYCQDAALIRAFQEDLDVHAFVAAEVNGVPLAEVTREMRSRAKAVNFGIIYGQTAFGLARGTGMSQTEAQAFIDRYFRRYPRIREFIDTCVADARQRGYVTTLLGRRRTIAGIDSRNRMQRAQAERFAVNTVMQGSAADLIKTAMNRLHTRIRAESLPLRLLLQVHDELVLEAPRGRAAAMAAVVAEDMSQAIPLRVPVKVDVHCADNWLEAK